MSLLGALVCSLGVAGGGEHDRVPAVRQRSDGSVEVPLEVDVAILKLAVDERCIFDSVSISFPRSNSIGQPVVLSRTGGPVFTAEPVVWELTRLNGALARAVRFGKMSDGDLRASFGRLFGADAPTDANSRRDRYALLEAIGTRRSESLRSLLAEFISEHWGEAGGDAARDTALVGVEPGYLELLTALRRVSGAGDPVSIQLDVIGPSRFPSLPRVAVGIVNETDHVLSLRRGGGGREGRFARVAVEVRNAARRLVHSRGPSIAGVDGLREVAKLNPGASVELALDVGGYSAPLAAGEYRIRVLYSDRLSLSDSSATTGKLAFSSEEASFTIQKREIRISRAERDAYDELVESLPSTGVVIVPKGEAASRAVSMEAPESAQAQLLQAGWAAVPSLVAVAERSDLPAGRRAWALATLFAIGGVGDPTHVSVLGGFTVRESTEDGDGEMVISEKRYAGSPSSISIDSQMRLVEFWKSILERCDVVTRR